MSRFYGDFDPASTATTSFVSETTTTTGSAEAVIVFNLESDTVNTGGGNSAGESISSSAGVFTFSTAVGTPYGAGTAAFTTGGNTTFGSAIAVDFVEFTSGQEFSFEYWAYFNGTPSAYGQIVDCRSDDANPGGVLQVAHGTGGRLVFSDGGGGSESNFIIRGPSTGIVTGAWQHFAVSRDASSTIRMFYDGVQVATTARAFAADNKATGGRPHFLGNVNNSSANLGGQVPGGAYLRDFRVIKDACIYTTAFTPPTSPLTTTSTNIVLATSSNTRTHSHVWNYTDVYDARFADTWPGNDPFASLVTTTGATAVEPGNGFRYLIFTTSGSLTVPSDAAGVSVEYLVVGGGGGGTANRGAGAGAGGLRTNVPGNPLAGTSMTLPAATYPVVVGAGGTSTTGAFPFDSGTRTAGTASSFNNIESAGGGRGAAGSGGSGAGGHTTPDPSASQNAGSGNVPPVTPPQGNDGGVGGSSSSGRGGGGGGAGSAGTPGGPAGGGPGAGGSGHPIPAFASPLIAPGIPSDAATAIGPTGLFAGGGGGGGSSYGLIPGGAAGPGGGGTGGRASINPGSSNPSSGEDGPAGAPGVDNTGGGGGGAGNYGGNNPAMRPGGVGGKGVVILRFPTTEK